MEGFRGRVESADGRINAATLSGVACPWLAVIRSGQSDLSGRSVEEWNRGRCSRHRRGPEHGPRACGVEGHLRRDRR
jgi:hypothetical protein